MGRRRFSGEISEADKWLPHAVLHKRGLSRSGLAELLVGHGALGAGALDTRAFHPCVGEDVHGGGIMLDADHEARWEAQVAQEECLGDAPVETGGAPASAGKHREAVEYRLGDAHGESWRGSCVSRRNRGTSREQWRDTVFYDGRRTPGSIQGAKKVEKGHS